MVVFPHAKVNLGLNVVSRREDGFHDIETVMLPIPLHDVLEVMVEEEAPAGTVLFERTGLVVPGDPGADLCMKAVRALAAGRVLPGLRLHLHKVVPLGAGLGGGSSDGAHTLRLVRDMLSLPVPDQELAAMAASLGSDVPFFLQHGPCLAEGRGEKLHPLQLSLAGWWMLLVNPGSHVATAGVYAHTKPTGAAWGLAHMLTEMPVEAWQDNVRNVMEEHVFSQHPEVGRAKAMMLGSGAVYAAMSGSGSSVFGLFREAPPDLAWPAGHKAWKLRLTA